MGIVFSSSEGYFFVHRALGTTPNMAPPSRANLPPLSQYSSKSPNLREGITDVFLFELVLFQVVPLRIFEPGLRTGNKIHYFLQYKVMFFFFISDLVEDLFLISVLYLASLAEIKLPGALF